MKYHKQQYINKLFNFALENNCDDFHVFLNFSGHVENIRIEIHIGGWKVFRKNDGEPDYVNDFHLSDEDEFKTESILKKLIELKGKR